MAARHISATTYLVACSLAVELRHAQFEGGGAELPRPDIRATPAGFPALQLAKVV